MANEGDPTIVGVVPLSSDLVVGGDGSQYIENQALLFSNDEELGSVIAQAMVGEDGTVTPLDGDGSPRGRGQHGWRRGYAANYDRAFGKKPDNPSLN